MVELDIELAHKTTSHKRFERTLAILVGLAAIVAALLATLEMHSSKRWEESSVRAANLSVELFGKIAATGPVTAATSATQQAAALRGVESAARSQAGGRDDLRLYLALVESRVGTGLLELSKDLQSTSFEDSDLDPVIQDVLAADTESLGEIAAEQREEVEATERYGTRISRALFALSLLALSAILLGLAAVLGLRNGGFLTLGAAAVALLVAAAWGGSALLV
jgi:hypothetical protein